MTAEHQQGLLDISIMILCKWLDPGELPAEMAISAITLAELSAGPHEVRRNEEQVGYDEHAAGVKSRHRNSTLAPWSTVSETFDDLFSATQ